MIITNDQFYVIPSIREIRHLKHALTLHSDFILLSECHIGNLKNMVQMCHKAGKKVIVNMELVGGLSLDKIGIKLLKQFFNVDIVIGSSPSKINMGKSVGLTTIQLITLLDSKSLETSNKLLSESKADIVDIRPGILGVKFLDTFKMNHNGPFLTGGFVDDFESIKAAKRAGFNGVSTSNRALWK